MSLKAPKWCSHAVPTPRGWANPTTGELYVSKRFSQEEIDEFHGNVIEVVEEMYQYAETPQMLHEAPVGNKSLEDMTKNELIALAEQLGVPVSKSATKKVLVEKLS